MSTLTLTIRPKITGRKVVVEMDRSRFERLAADLGLFRMEFLESIDRAEREIALGKAKHLTSLRDLRNA